MDFIQAAGEVLIESALIFFLLWGAHIVANVLVGGHRK